MIRLTTIIALSMTILTAHAESSQIVKINLNYVFANDVISVLKSLVDGTMLLSGEDNVLLVKGDPVKSKNIINIVKEMDKPPAALTIEFIASSKKLDFESRGNVTLSSRKKNNVSQSMAITERQWVTLKTGLSIPITERNRHPDGTETQSFRYEKISRSYVFKVHEFSGWAVIQVGMNVSSPSVDVADAIENTQLDTTIVGQTGKWLEVASSQTLISDETRDKHKVYSTQSRDKNIIHLYLRVKENNTSEKLQSR